MAEPVDDSISKIIVSSTQIGRAAAVDDVITLVGELSKVYQLDPKFLNDLFSELSRVISGAPHDHSR